MIDREGDTKPAPIDDEPPAGRARLSAHDRRQVEEWALVLASQAIATRFGTDSAGSFWLELEVRDEERARAALDAWARENPAPEGAGASPTDGDRPETQIDWTGAGVALALIGIHLFAADGRHDFLLARASADAERILEGEWWRALTALCLHADLGHVLANALAGLYFIGAVCRSLGRGLGLSLIGLAGMLGNLATAALHSSGHDSVGASTAVFGAIGILVGLALGRRRRAGLRGRELWLPLAAGLGLLAMLGTGGGERVDLWAHLCGLLAGAAAGAVSSVSLSSRLPGPTQRLLGVTSLAVLRFAWSLALGR